MPAYVVDLLAQQGAVQPISPTDPTYTERVPPVGVRDLIQGGSWPFCFRVPALEIQAIRP